MRTSRHGSLLAIFAFLITTSLCASPALDAQLDRVGSFTAGDPAPCYETTPEIAAQPGGSFLLLWSGGGCAGTTTGFHRALRFDAAGRRLGGEVEHPLGSEANLVALPDGGFLAVSAREPIDSPASLQTAIRLHRLDALGRPVGAPVQVAFDYDEFAYSSDPRLAVAPNGNVAVVWYSSNVSFPGFFFVMGRFYDSTLTPFTDAFPLAAIETGFQATPDIAFAADSTALAVWSQSSDFTTYGGIYGRRFNTAGHPTSEAFPISPQQAGQQKVDVRVVSRASGGWWAAWTSLGATDQPGETRIVRLGPDGLPVVAEQSLGVPRSNQSRPAIGTDSADRALLLGRSPDGKIVGRLFDGTGLSATAPFPLSEGSLSFVSATLPDRGATSFQVAWSGFDPSVPGSADLFGAIFTIPCLPGGNAACLGPDGRYAVEIAWRNGSQSGTAKPLPLAGNVATFGLRNVADHEVAVLLSGPGARDLTFSATTGAALDIRVTDKTTGMVRTFAKPAGRFASQRFLGALPSISATFGEPLGSAADSAAAPAAAPALGEPCVPTSRALCLLGGRFRAELLAGANPRPALAILRTDRSGMFAFPSAPEIPLVVLTMTDGRAANGKFWVYLGGLAPKGYKVKVTDLETGQTKLYANPSGRIDSRADRTAF